MESSKAVVPDAPTLTQGAEAWSRLCERLAQRARLDAEIVELTGIVQRSGTIEMLEGVPLDTALNLVHRMPRSDRSMQLTAADVLGDMPATAALFRAGELAWGQVRGIVAEAKRLSRADRAVLDRRIGASGDRFEKLDPDDAFDAIRIAAEELRDVRKTERVEDRAERANFIWAQPRDVRSGRGVRRARQPLHGDAARAVWNPAVSVIVDTRDATATVAGTIQIKAPGCLPTLTVRAVEALAADASVQVVLVDGGRPLAVTKKVRASAVPGDVRRAVLLRDCAPSTPCVAVAFAPATPASPAPLTDATLPTGSRAAAPRRPLRGGRRPCAGR